MPVLGITGGIATGKSGFGRALLDSLPAASFDADAAVHELLASDEAVRAAIVAGFGSEILGENGWPDRLRLRAVVFREGDARQRLEAILHPAVRARWQKLAAEYRHCAEWLYVDIPLLYETEAESEFSRVVVVACARETQLARLREQRQLAESLIASILAAQIDLGKKVASADHVVWNDSSPACLHRQARLLADSLRNLYG